MTSSGSSMCWSASWRAGGRGIFCTPRVVRTTAWGGGLAREGQVFFLHNRVWNIQSVADEIRALVPDARIVIGHGQMNEHELEEVMHKFIRHEADILVSTTIID